MRRATAVLLSLLMVTAACTRETEETTTTRQAEPTTTSTMATASTTTTTVPDAAVAAGLLPGSPAAFAGFQGIPLLAGGAPYPGPPLPNSLSGVIKPSSLELEPEQEALLLEQGFVVEPGGYRLFQSPYHGYEIEEVYFVTTDVGYHFLHLAFSKLLRDLEEQTLLPILEELVAGLVEAARAQADALSDTDLEDAADRVQQLYEAAAELLDLDVGAIGPLAQQEVDLAREAAQLVASPTTSFEECDPLRSLRNCIDYSLFKPRGHYTRSDDLERYFRAMSLLGQASFFVHDPDSLRVGALAARLLVGDPDLVEGWELVYEPTAFMVGIADDYTPFELIDAAAEVVGTGLDEPAVFADPGMLEQLAAALSELREVGIDPENAAVRTMGVRFVLDSYIYDQLRYPHVGDPPFGRRLASPLDLAATFGSDLAYRLQEAAGETRYTNYESQLAAMRSLVEDRTAADWAGTVYDAWLYALMPVLVPHDQVYPDFMRTSAWEAKGLQTGLASYAELKHDTILYAKQSFAAEGGFEPLREPPRHWVEPEPVAFGRMAAVIGLLQDGLRDRGLVVERDDQDNLMTAVRGLLDRFARIASDELAGLPISVTDNDWLGQIGGTLEALWIASSDWDEDLTAPSAQDTDSAIIADIMRTSLQYLEIGIGDIDLIWVLVPNDSGRFQVAKGAVFSYYEFWRDAQLGRLTDDEWRALLDSGERPARPSWQEPLFRGGAPASGVTAGLLCRDLEDAGYDFTAALAYWMMEGRPGRMDADGNGIPCETVFPDEAESLFASIADLESNLFCRDLAERGRTFEQAVAYWAAEGAPDRMDADRNGVPCETVFAAEEVAAFVSFDR